MKLLFDVTGMTCASCSSRVDKATRSVAGVADVAVNLLKNSMEVQLAEGADAAAVSAEIEAAVKKAGYGASPKGSGRPAANGAAGSAAEATQNSGSTAEAEQKSMLHRLIASLVFTVPLFYIAMGDMFGWPLPSVLTGMENMMVYALTLLLLLVPIIFINFRFFRVGLRALVSGSPNMDSLIALGSGAATIYGLYALFNMAFSMGHADLQTAHHFAMNLYFESAGMISDAHHVGQVPGSAREGQDHQRAFEADGSFAQDGHAPGRWRGSTGARCKRACGRRVGGAHGRIGAGRWHGFGRRRLG